ncbi:hypothetical protein GFH48_28010 [Streptomyces fagopyri]|uniref:Uncharacterized protein n=1 Tax=Streptomyces fagopyri TaxID=2662397 RepID=A0A5Q0LHT9_9ACTN|nr:hypothetical protein GFH48_28010 [Streptomyces fagopyri]
MPAHQRPRITDTSPIPYRSTACRLGTHHACSESSPDAAPVDVPVVYEACACPCHSTPSRPAPTEVQQ